MELELERMEGDTKEEGDTKCCTGCDGDGGEDKMSDFSPLPPEVGVDVNDKHGVSKVEVFVRRMANAAKWSGKHPCRDSLSPAAFGWALIKANIALQASIQGSV